MLIENLENTRILEDNCNADDVDDAGDDVDDVRDDVDDVRDDVDEPTEGMTPAPSLLMDR